MRKQYHWIQAIIIWFAFFTMYVFKINHTAGIDEIMTFFKYTRLPTDILLYDAPNNHILHSFFVWISTSLLGNSLIAIRLPGFMAGIISLALLYRLGNRWRNHYIGLVSMLLMGITLSFLTFINAGRGYTLTILFTILLIENVSKVSTSTSMRQRFYTFILSLCLLLIMPSNVYLILSIILWQFIVGWQLEKSELLKNTAPLFISSAIGTVFYISILITNLPSGLTHEFEVGIININVFILDVIRSLFEIPSLSILLFGIFLWGALTTFQQYRKPKFFLIAVIIFVSIFGSIVQLVVTHMLFFGRNFLYLLPLTSIISAMGIYRLKKLRLNFMIPLLLLLVGLWGIQTTNTNTNIRNWLTTLEENTLDGDIVFIGPAIYDPIYYHVRVLGETSRDYFAPSDQSDRFVIVPTTCEWPCLDADELISIHGLQQYINECTEEVWDSQKVVTCPIVNPPYSRVNSSCFVSIYPYWRECSDADNIKVES